MVHVVNPRFRASNSHLYLILNGSYFSYLISQQPLSSFSSLRLKKKKKKADHWQDNLDPRRSGADAQWEKIGHPDLEGRLIKTAYSGLVLKPDTTEAISLLCDQHADTSTELHRQCLWREQLSFLRLLCCKPRNKYLAGRGVPSTWVLSLWGSAAHTAPGWSFHVAQDI